MQNVYITSRYQNQNIKALKIPQLIKLFIKKDEECKGKYLKINQK